MPRLKDIQEAIILTALNYLGQREVSGNMGFQDPVFEQKMKAVGFEKGQAWCAYFAELVWKEAYGKYYTGAMDQLDKLFSAMAVKNWLNFSKDGRFICDQTPEPGSIVIWQNYTAGKPDWRGHAGIVVGMEDKISFASIEGNTNQAGGREGIEVAKKKRTLQFSVDNGLRLKGFIHPVDPVIFMQ